MVIPHVPLKNNLLPVVPNIIKQNNDTRFTAVLVNTFKMSLKFHLVYCINQFLLVTL